ncbi:MAG TPA: redoxin domain-containing protein [Polyangiaceae bacterium]|nr:redoxin domain-containing protein [Polyangiaceae bacterium]
MRRAPPSRARARAIAFLIAGAVHLNAARVGADDTNRPWLGVAMDAEPRAASPGSPQSGPARSGGVRVAHVVRGSPADRAGVREGDRLVRVDNLPVASGSDVIRAVAARAAGDAVDVVFLRDGATRSARVVLASFPDEDDMARMDLVGAAAPTWKGLAAVSGVVPSSVEALRGHVLLIDFWATWCAPCRLFTSKLGALQLQYGAQGFSVLGVSTEDAQHIADFARRVAIKYPVAVDTHGETTRSYGVTSLPTIVLVDKRGTVRDVAIGYDGDEDARLDAAIRALLAEPLSSGPSALPLDPQR